jgi:hypothetical protein
MATLPVVRNRAAGSLQDEFLELVCGDEELLRAEFDAIIAEEWGTRRPPPARPRATSPAPRPHGSAPLTGPLGLRRRRPRHPGIGGWSRQRSPPDEQPVPPTGTAPQCKARR